MCRVMDLYNTNQIPYTQTVQYTARTQNNCTITQLTPCIQPVY